ncbi:hypothetical protein LINPERPRIM_LOCUS44196 [Linum perenne]
MSTSTWKSKRGSAFFKHIISSLLVKAKSAIGVGNKTSAVLKAQASLVLGRKKKVVASVCDKINTLVLLIGAKTIDDHSIPKNQHLSTHPCCCCTNTCIDDEDELPEINNHDEMSTEEDEEQQCLYVSHHLFLTSSSLDVEEDEDDDHHHQMVDNYNNIEEERNDDIDEVANMFIKRFHKQMRLQKLESFKRYQQMLQRSL